MKNMKKILINILIVILLCVCAYCLYNIFIYYYEDYQVTKQSEKFQNIYYENKGDSVDVGEKQQIAYDLKEINPDYIGWIKVQGTNVDYPVVQTDNNDLYLYTSFENEFSRYGTIFADYRYVSDDFRILYGHHIKEGAMFAEIYNFKNQDFLNENNDIMLDIDGEIQHYKIFAWCEMDLSGENYFDYTVKDNDLDNYLNSVKNYAGYYQDPESTQILILSTCSYISDDARFALFAYKV